MGPLKHQAEQLRFRMWSNVNEYLSKQALWQPVPSMPHNEFGSRLSYIFGNMIQVRLILKNKSGCIRLSKIQ